MADFGWLFWLIVLAILIGIAGGTMTAFPGYGRIGAIIAVCAITLGLFFGFYKVKS